MLSDIDLFTQRRLRLFARRTLTILTGVRS